MEGGIGGHAASAALMPFEGNAEPHGKPSQGGSAQLGAAEEGGWQAAAAALSQDVAASLQPGRDDLRPLSDVASSYEALCCRASQLTSQTAAACCGGAPALQQLPCVARLVDGVMQLAAAVFCDPEVAQQLLASGAYAAASEQLKGAVKELTGHLVRWVEAAQQQQHVAGNAGDAGDDGPLLGLMPAVRAAAQQLLRMALALASFIAGAPPPAAAGGGGGTPDGGSQPPREMRSMAVLNLSWASLTRLLLAVPAGARPSALDEQGLLQGLRCALQQLQRAVRDLPQQAPERREVVARFWLQSASRLASAVWERAALQALPALFEAALEVYRHVSVAPRDGLDDVQEFLQSVLQPRLAACVAVLLCCGAEDPVAVRAKLGVLTGPTACQPAAAAAAGGGGALGMPEGSLQRPQQQQQQQHHHHHTEQQRQQQLLRAQLLLVLDLLQQQLPAMPPELVQEAARPLLAWVVRTAGAALCPLVLAAEEGAALLQRTLQGCLACTVGCAAALQPRQLRELHGEIARLALSEHPLVACIARQLLADVAACGGWEAQARQLSGLLQLLEGAAACAAVPAAGASMARTTQRLVDALAAVLQASDAEPAAAWVGQRVLGGAPILSGGECSGAGGGGWHDAASCSLLVCVCGLLLRLGGLHPGPGEAQLDGALQQVWLQAEQVLDAAQPPTPPPEQQQQQQQAVAAPAASSSCEQLAALHQLAWLLEAMAALVQLRHQQQQQQQQEQQQACGATLWPPPRVYECCAELARGALSAVERSEGPRVQSGNPPAAAAGDAAALAGLRGALRAACAAAALKLLAAVGPGPAPGSADELLALLQALAHRHEGLHPLMAAVCGNLGIPAGNARHEELFQQLLSSPLWAARHAAFEALLTRLRHNNYSGSGIVRLLPPDMRCSATEARPEVVEAVKAHLHRAPDSQAHMAFVQTWAQLAESHSQELAAAAWAAGPTAACGGGGVSGQLGGLEALVAAACSHSGGVGGLQPRPGSAGEPSGAAQAILQLAAAAANSLGSLERALEQAEAQVRQLMAAASHASRGQALLPEDVGLVARQGASLAGGCASMCSRLRALQDSLSCLRS